MTLTSTGFGLDLLDAGACTPACLLAGDSEACDCRCRGAHHGELRARLTAEERTSLVGTYLAGRPPCRHCGAEAGGWQGWYVSGQLDAERFLLHGTSIFATGERIAGWDYISQFMVYRHSADFDIKATEAAANDYFHTCPTKEARP